MKKDNEPNYLVNLVNNKQLLFDIQVSHETIIIESIQSPNHFILFDSGDPQCACSYPDWIWLITSGN